MSLSVSQKRLVSLFLPATNLLVCMRKGKGEGGGKERRNEEARENWDERREWSSRKEKKRSEAKRRGSERREEEGREEGRGREEEGRGIIAKLNQVVCSNTPFLESLESKSPGGGHRSEMPGLIASLYVHSFLPPPSSLLLPPPSSLLSPLSSPLCHQASSKLDHQGPNSWAHIS
jgi:hypothetical protein